MGFFYFLGQKKFYINLVIAIVVGVVLFWLALKSLDSFTRHGDIYIVPDFDGKTLSEIKAQSFDEFFDLQIIDSVFDQKRERGTIVMQHPLPGSRVKQGRHIYLTIVSESPEMVQMPNLKNLSLRQALVTLESVGLRAGELIYVEYFARNAIVQQLVDDEPVETGTEITKGSTVDLEVGHGEVAITVPIPVLIAKKQSESRTLLHYAYLNIGKEYFLDGDDTAHARVYKTEPSPLTEDMLGLGDKVDIWYRSDEFFDFDNYLQDFIKDSLEFDTNVDKHIIRGE